MRRNNYPYQPLTQTSTDSSRVAVSQDALEEENERSAEELKQKIGALKSLTIDIGHEVRYQDKLLRGIDDDMDRTHGFLSNTMGRVVRLESVKNDNTGLDVIQSTRKCFLKFMMPSLKFRKSSVRSRDTDGTDTILRRKSAIGVINGDGFSRSSRKYWLTIDEIVDLIGKSEKKGQHSDAVNSRNVSLDFEPDYLLHIVRFFGGLSFVTLRVLRLPYHYDSAASVFR
uniref:BET1 homolog n=1 Tax=Glossina pallidipes TaxID=7398 RepID=A0A1B0AI95_GLOPL